MKKHKILIELDRFRAISEGRLRHHILHKAFDVSEGDLACFQYKDADPTKNMEFCTEVTFVDLDMPGVGGNHYLISFKLL